MDWKTTVTGIVVGLATILAHFGLIIPESFTVVIIAIGVAVLGWLTADRSTK